MGWRDGRSREPLYEGKAWVGRKVTMHGVYLVGKRMLDLTVVCSCYMTIHPFIQSTARN